MDVTGGHLWQVFVAAVKETPRGYFRPFTSMANAVRMPENGGTNLTPRGQEVCRSVIASWRGKR